MHNYNIITAPCHPYNPPAHVATVHYGTVPYFDPPFTGRHEWLTLLAFECDDGYNLQEESGFMRCHSDGYWTGWQTSSLQAVKCNNSSTIR